MGSDLNESKLDAYIWDLLDSMHMKDFIEKIIPAANTVVITFSINQG